MIIIWGSRGREKTIAQGQFYCPQCRVLRAYSHKKISKYFTLYFIPLFATKDLAEYVECQVCHGTFKTEVLQYSETLHRGQQAKEQAAQMIREISNQLEAGIPLQLMASSLKEAGANEDAVSAAMSAATQGMSKVCQTCSLSFTAAVQYCSGCGRPLSAPPSG